MSAWEAFVAGVLLGAAGFLHCAGMCGIFALQAAADGRGLWRGFLPWWAGKSLAYLGLGVVAGSIGARVTAVFPRAQGWLGVATGAVVITAGIWLWRGRGAAGNGLLARFLAPLLASLRAAAATRGRVVVGFATGLLPCGLTGLAALQAAAAGRSIAALSVMAGLALGTLPSLALVTAAGRAGRRGLPWPKALLLRGAGMLVVCAGSFAVWRSTLTLLAADRTDGMPCCH